MKSVEFRGEVIDISTDVLKLDGVGLKDISEIVGLEEATNLTYLILSNNEITEIKGLDTLTNLDELYLNNNKIKSISGLENLNKLLGLYLQENQITELEGLNGLDALISLYLQKNKITQIQGLENLKDLVELNLADNLITEISGLDNLNVLKFLYLTNNKISEIKGLDRLKNLNNLSLQQNSISEIKGLDNLKNLKNLNLYSNKIAEIKNLEKLENLESLQLYNNNISKIEGIGNLKKLKLLNLLGNPVQDLIVKKLGGANKLGFADNPRGVVEYCITGKYEVFEKSSDDYLISKAIKNPENIKTLMKLTEKKSRFYQAILEILIFFSRAIERMSNISNKICQEENSKQRNFLLGQLIGELENISKINLNDLKTLDKVTLKERECISTTITLIETSQYFIQVFNDLYQQQYLKTEDLTKFVTFIDGLNGIKGSLANLINSLSNYGQSSEFYEEGIFDNPLTRDDKYDKEMGAVIVQHIKDPAKQKALFYKAVTSRTIYLIKAFKRIYGFIITVNPSKLKKQYISIFTNLKETLSLITEINFSDLGILDKLTKQELEYALTVFEALTFSEEFHNAFLILSRQQYQKKKHIGAFNQFKKDVIRILELLADVINSLDKLTQSRANIEYGTINNPFKDVPDSSDKKKENWKERIR